LYWYRRALFLAAGLWTDCAGIYSKAGGLSANLPDHVGSELDALQVVFAKAEEFDIAIRRCSSWLSVGLFPPWSRKEQGS
jgi:hypothetical protein